MMKRSIQPDIHARIAAMLLVIPLLSACSDPPPQALGTLEYDRIALPSPAAERIVSIDVRDQSGKAQARTPRTEPLTSTAIFDAPLRAADERVAQIVAANMGRKLVQAPAAAPPAH